MTTIEIAAYESVEVTGLTATHARLLAATKAVTVTPSWGREAWTLSSGPYVGVLRCEDLELRIRPRISIARLIFLLGYTNDPRVWRDDPAGLEDQFDLWPAMAQVFSRQADKALERGLLQGYRTEESAQFVLRGRLREADQLRLHAGLSLPLELRFDEFDIDIPENRLLRAATERLLRVPRLPPAAVRRLRHLRGRLADVSPLIPGQPLPATTASRLNQRYQPALGLARMVLRTRSVDILDAGVRATGFLVNMNTVFEDFVAVALAEALRPFGGRTVSQDTAHTLDVGGAIRLRPDLVHYDTLGRPDALADAKYKAETPSGYPYADLYQMLSYCTALGVPVGHLVYAQGESSAARHEVVNAGITVVQHALDLRQPVRGLLADVDRLAGELVARAPSPVAS